MRGAASGRRPGGFAERGLRPGSGRRLGRKWCQPGPALAARRRGALGARLRMEVRGGRLRRGPSPLGGVLWIVASVFLLPAKGLGPKRRFHQSPRSRFLLQRCSKKKGRGRITLCAAVLQKADVLCLCFWR